MVTGTEKHSQWHSNASSFGSGNLAENVFRAVCHQKCNLIALFQPNLLKSIGYAISVMAHFPVRV
jgi:hypothetical protein